MKIKYRDSKEVTITATAAPLLVRDLGRALDGIANGAEIKWVYYDHDSMGDPRLTIQFLLEEGTVS